MKPRFTKDAITMAIVNSLTRPQVTEASIAANVATIRSEWTPEERAARQAEGIRRTNELATTLGIELEPQATG